MPTDEQSGRRGWRTCKLCKSRVPLPYMAIKAVPAEHGHWNPVDADWCARCAERRAEGVKDEEGMQKRIGSPYGSRLESGFELLSEDGSFGESEEEVW